MPSLETILSNLADAEIAPPPTMYNSIKEVLFTDEISKENTIEGLLLSLNNHEVSPPVKSYNKIVSQLQFAAPITPVKSIKGGSNLRYFRIASAVAAALLICVVGWFIFNNNKVINDLPGIIAKTDDPIVKPALPITKEDSVATNHPANKKRKPTQSKNPFFEIENLYQFTADGQRLYVQDNDLLFTFASYTSYSQVPGFLKDESDQSIKVQIDQYSSLNMSSKARKIMRTMYETRRNGKATNKAKRAQRKITRWQKADQSKFDRTLEKNPLDPIDMADFLF